MMDARTVYETKYNALVAIKKHIMDGDRKFSALKNFERHTTGEVGEGMSDIEIALTTLCDHIDEEIAGVVGALEHCPSVQTRDE